MDNRLKINLEVVAREVTHRVLFESAICTNSNHSSVAVSE